jgi:two-component system, cell cycle sensor histidine kinase and response regulator CckA
VRGDEALRETELRYQTFIEQLPLVVYTTCPSNSGRVLYISPQIEALLGYPVDAWLRDSSMWERTLHPEDRERALAEMDSPSSAVPAHSQYRLVAADGRAVTVIDRKVSTCQADGRRLFNQGFLVDISEQASLEEQLRQSQRLEAIGRLAGGVAHDFNNLLMAIAGHSELAARRSDDDVRGIRRDVEQIAAAAERARALTQKLLAFGRKQVLREQLVDAGGAIRELEELLRPVLGERIELVLEVASDLSPVAVDLGQFEQLLLNLTLNARDAMPAGGTLTITARNLELDQANAAPLQLKAGSYVAIAVIDTGTGMDPATLAQVFDPFFTTKPMGEGTGLGLASAYGFVTQSRGQIRVDSTAGSGTTFEILLPPGLENLASLSASR